jgi:hypothetical protein
MMRLNGSLAIAATIVAAAIPLAALSARPLAGDTTRPTSGEAPDERLEALRQIIVKGAWVRALGDSRQAERYIYRFKQDGNYVNSLRSDVDVTFRGTWRLEFQHDGLIHLTMDGPKKTYWLPPDSIVEYDPKLDALVLSGPSYVGRIPLKHEDLQK